MLEGVTVKPLIRRPDERGFFVEVMRSDWKDLLDEDVVVQANVSMTYPGIIRAWHRHLKGQTDNFVALWGALKICAYDDKTKELDEVVATGIEPRVVRVPGHYWHGFKVVGNEPALLLYFVNRLYDYKDPDEERRPWDDPAIVPRSINGRPDDPRVGTPWDWLAPPHR